MTACKALSAIVCTIRPKHLACRVKIQRTAAWALLLFCAIAGLQLLLRSAGMTCRAQAPCQYRVQASNVRPVLPAQIRTLATA